MNAKKWLTTAALVALAVGMLWVLKNPSGLGERTVLDLKSENRDGVITVEDSDGFKLSFENPPCRILPCNSSIVDLILALVDPERVVALPEQADTWSLVALDAKRFEDYPRLHRYLAETVVVHRPDLVLVSQFNTPDTNARLREMNVPLLRLPIRNNLDDVAQTLTMLAGILDAQDRLRTVLEDIRTRREKLREFTSSSPGGRALFYSNYGTGGWTYGDNSTVDSFIKMAGLENAAGGGGGSGSRRITFEEVLSFDPDLIIVSAAENGARGATRRLLENTPTLKGLRALKKGHIIELPPRLAQASSQEMLTAAETLASAWSERAGGAEPESAR